MLEPDWAGETVFIIAGGPSVAQQNLDLLRGRRILAVNSSYERLERFGGPPPHLPHIDLLLFGDNRWWNDRRFPAESEKRRAEILSLGCPLISVAQTVRHEKVLTLRKRPPPGLSNDRKFLAMRKTTLSAALNAAAFKAPGGTFVLLGADGKFGADGKRNHHQSVYPWRHIPGCWDRHYSELKTLVQPLKDAGITVLNASPESAWDLWPLISLEDAIQTRIAA